MCSLLSPVVRAPARRCSAAWPTGSAQRSRSRSEQHEAIAFYLLDVGSTIPPTAPAATVHLSERFKVEHGLITQIEAIFTVGTGPLEGSGWPAPHI
jgi:hypothetical protein